jgi:hypothetical protein
MKRKKMGEKREEKPNRGKQRRGSHFLLRGKPGNIDQIIPVCSF